MISLDIIAGHFLPSLFGWTFLVFVVAAESLLLTKYLTKKWIDNKIYMSVFISNLITTAIGYYVLDEKRIGGHLLNWIPVDYHHGNIRIGRTILIFILSFIGTIIIETQLNTLFLRNLKCDKRVSTGTLLTNSFTYAIGAIIIFFYNFCNPL